jgi:KDO2-lipid IV(A) lauroyltransferase
LEIFHKPPIREREKRERWSLREPFLVAINLIPLIWRIRIFEGIFRILFAADGRHRRIAERNLAIAFPDRAPSKRSRLALKAFKNLGRVAGEFPHICRFNEKNIHQYLSLEGIENFHRAQQKGKGVLFLTAHFGNWEWMAAGFPLLAHHNSHVIFRPLDNRFLDGLVDRVRKATGNQTVPKDKSMGQILRLLKAGKTVGILLDQNMAWQEGVFVNFFGELACTNIGMALLALRTDAPVVPVFNFRQPNGRYRMVIEPEVFLIRTGDHRLDIEKNTALFTQIIEKHVRNYPDHWLWVHQRWKTRPWQAKR